MRKLILIILFCMLFVYVLDHSYFVASTAAVLTGLAFFGCMLYLWSITHRS